MAKVLCQRTQQPLVHLSWSKGSNEALKNGLPFSKIIFEVKCSLFAAPERNLELFKQQICPWLQNLVKNRAEDIDIKIWKPALCSRSELGLLC